MCKRKDCLYIPPPTHKNGCDYAYLTDRLRNCPIESCTRYRHATESERQRYRECMKLIMLHQEEYSEKLFDKFGVSRLELF